MVKKANNLPSIEVLKIGVNAIQEMIKLEERWDKTFQEMYDGQAVPQYFNGPIKALCEIIEKTYNDIPGEYGSHISWWIWEAECGKRLDLADSVIDQKTGKHIPMRTIEDVYSYYIKYNFKGDN